ncbi:MAG: 3-deoxy-7-phosphoheptulonate synthase class II [Pseudomonadota bacterium]|jgi:3-deoxy-7-phosphoheptulonate synthase|nr:3-deoxy-7-phosphoheptulonate synthase class II [Pseudomonadota bacterium]
MPSSETPSAWTPASWRSKPVRQLPAYPDPARLAEVEHELGRRLPLIFAGEIALLRERLARVARGEAFLLQGGDCAEAFDDLSDESVRGTFRVLLQMAVVLTFAAACPVVKIGRIAGQFAKPRSADTETRDGRTLPSYRGDIVNAGAFDARARTPDPARLLRAYAHSASTLNLLRALARGGYADLRRVHGWTTDFVARSPQGERYAEVAGRITEALAFFDACGFGAMHSPQVHEVEFFTSHEALHLPYEQALARQDAVSGRWYAGSAHMLWIGERTREAEGAHVEFLRGVDNPVGVKIGPTATPAQLQALLAALDPQREAGRIVLISRMGADRVREALPPLIEAAREEAHPVVWCCDPMHGNTTSTADGIKTRDFDRILDEVRGYFEAHAGAGTWPGGVHFELTGLDVTECTGGGQRLTEADLAQRYRSACDPRLNGSQSLELAFLVAGMLKAARPVGAGAGPT